MQEKLCLKDVKLFGKKVLVRLDFNVPISNGIIDDDTRVLSSLPTIKYLIEHKAKIILLSHLGRVSSLKDRSCNTLRPVGELLKKLLPGVKVDFCDKCVGEEVKTRTAKMHAGDVLLLENTRFCDVNDDGKVVKLESGCDDTLARFWASLADVFVNDAFGTIHRKHASNYGVAKYIKVKCIGFLIQKELSGLEKLLNHPTSPYVVIMGGAKAADKIALIRNFLKTADTILLAGGIATSFLNVKGYDVGKSIIDKQSTAVISELMSLDQKHKLVLPVDFIVAKEFIDAPGKVLAVGQSFGELSALDIGPKTCDLFAKEIRRAKTVFWNGPPGVFEFANFSQGTKAVAEAMVEAKKNGAYTLVGGGDSASAINKLGMSDQVSFVSTGGGASLTLLEGTTLPSLEIINNKE